MERNQKLGVMQDNHPQAPLFDAAELFAATIAATIAAHLKSNQ